MTRQAGAGRKAALVIGCGLVGWAMCGATMGLGMAFFDTGAALIIHAAAAPIFFIGISLFYFRQPAALAPLAAASAMLGLVIFMDVFVVALFIEKSFDMFRSFIGTWLPFILIFFAVDTTGRAVRRMY